MSLDAFGALDGATCSRAGCVAAGVWRLSWRNPRIHGLDRVKMWLACDEHREFLSAFLEARGFLLAVDALEEQA
ncbi:MAG: hypothetical protein ACKOXM_04380 [Agromyces sp.]